jgi:dihydropteroate synthase
MGYTLTWDAFSLDLGGRSHIMGILNVTPDSFSDGNRYFQKDIAVSHGIAMARDGADIIDVGGESTRPYSRRVSAEEEMDRVLPVIEALRKEVDVPISIDTYKSDVAGAALEAGASMINDVSALRFDPEMGEVAAKASVPVVLMHMKGTPESMQDGPAYRDLLSEIVDFLHSAKERAVSAGIRQELLIVDPGIGFGKTFDDNLTIIRELSRLQTLRSPILLGTSNKAFIGRILDKEADERDVGTMATVAAAVLNGAHILRVHEVRKAVETVKVIDAIQRGHVEP